MNWKIQYYEDWSSSFGVLTQLVCTSNPVFFICVNFWQICLKILKIVSWFPEKQSRCFEPALSVFRGDNLPWNIQLAEKRWYMNPWDSYWDIFFFSSLILRKKYLRSRYFLFPCLYYSLNPIAWLWRKRLSQLNREKHRGTEVVGQGLLLVCLLPPCKWVLLDQEEIELWVKEKVDRVVLDCIRKRD